MSQTFQFHRFYLLLKMSIMERPMAVIGTCIAGLATTALIYLFFQSIGAYHPAQYISFAVGLVGGGCLMASLVFAHFSSEANGIAYLTLPGSRLEKWLVGFLIAAVYVGLFIVFYKWIDTFFVESFRQKLDPLDPHYQARYNSLWTYEFTEEKEFLIFFVNCFCLMLIGSIYFNRMAFIKTALLIIVLIFLALSLNLLIMRTMVPDVARAVPLQSVVIANNGKESAVLLSANAQQWVGWMIGIVLPLSLLLTSFLKLKEKEI